MAILQNIEPILAENKNLREFKILKVASCLISLSSSNKKYIRSIGILLNTSLFQFPVLSFDFFNISVIEWP